LNMAAPLSGAYSGTVSPSVKKNGSVRNGMSFKDATV
jgi:hypothetical protein